MASEVEQAAMRRAVALSRAVLGTTSPNPPVGAVVLGASGAVVGEGATRPPGGPHAEVVALAAAGERARGGTLVVTLEPCRHTGRTGPCTQALLAAGVARVVIACADPTAAAGGGARELTDAGLDVETGVLADEAGDGPLEAWLGAQRLGRPFVTWKYAATLDGRSAAADGTSRWITSAAARADVARLRGEVDAVLVGVGTVLADDPLLTVRPDPGHQPLRVVLDSRHRAPVAARVFDDQAPTWWVSAAADDAADDADGAPANDAAPGPGAAYDVRLAAGPDGRVEPGAVLAALGAHGVVSALLEGGPTLAASFVRAGLVDRVVGYVAPALLGAGPAALSDIGVGTIDQSTRLLLGDVLRVGDDVRLTMRPALRPAGRSA